MKKRLLITSLLCSAFALAGNTPQTECYLTQKGTPSVTWQAYKTPLKIGVGGTFDSIDLALAQPKGVDLQTLLTDATLTLDEKSVNSGNKGRDAKLVTFFFDKMKEKQIKTKVLKLVPNADKPSTGTITTEITMNGITKTVPLRYNYENDTLQASGTIDLFDFQASSALSALNKACFDLHQGKTWNDVSISFQLQLTKTCNTPK